MDHAIKVTLALCKKFNVNAVRYSKTDLKSAFRILPLNPKSYQWLVMQAKDPISGRTYYFVDKCLPFGVSISCVLFQRFSNTLKHILEYRIWKHHSQRFFGAQLAQLIHFITNYLDDFLFIAFTTGRCNQIVNIFLQLCVEIGVPVSEDKTEWGSIKITFLGMMLDGDRFIITIPEDKRQCH